MKICMFTNTYLPHVGGVARSVANFTRDLRKRDHAVLVVTPYISLKKYRGKKEYDKDVLRMPALQNFNGSDFSVRIPLPFYISEKMENFQPEIIHSHHPFLLGDNALRTARNRNLPLVFTHHTMYEQYTHYVPFDSKAMKRFVMHLSTQYANLCDLVIAPSKSIADLLQSRGVKTPIEEIPTGIDPEFFMQGRGEKVRSKYHIPAQAFVLGHVGRLAPEKNLDYLARSVGIFLQKNEQAYFLLVGEGPSQESIKSILSAYNVQHRLVLAGKRINRDLSDAYQAMDAFVFSSKSETQGLVLAEAMAAGLPVVALDASGTREVVCDGVNGRLLDDDTSEEMFARALFQMWSQPEQIAHWKEKAQETAREFSRDKMAEKLEEVYGYLVNNYSREKKDRSYEEDIISWNTLQRSLKAEWALISKKAAAMVNAVREESSRPDK